MKLLPTQKNDVFDIIVQEDLNPNDFGFNEELSDSNEIATKLQFKKTKYFFIFKKESIFSGFDAYYSPGHDSLEIHEHARTWKGLSPILKKWLTSLKREINVVDKWEIFKNEVKLIPF